MILSNVEIHRALDEGRLILTPEPTPRLPGQGRGPCPYQTTAVDLRLGNEIMVPVPDRPFDIDLGAGRFADLASKGNYETRVILEDQPFALRPGQFALAKTLERVELPIREGQVALAARIEGRSSFARCGMLVHFSAPTIHAGFRGTIALEMINLAPTTIVLYPGARVCQLTLEEVQGLPARNESQFQGQGSPLGSRLPS